MKIGMREVAQHAGVSVATVSHVINKTRYVSEETIRRVQQSIKELGYVPDPIGRILKTGKKNLIGFIVPDIANPVWSIIIEEVESTIAAYGSKLIIANTKETASREIENIQLLASGIVDGLITATTLPDFEIIRGLVPKGFPMVFLDREINNCPCDTVLTEDYTAFYRGVERLIRDGHRNIGFITGLMSLSTTKIRLNAYMDAMRAGGLPILEDFVQRNGASTTSNLVPLLQKLLNANCTALAVSNNILLEDALRDLRKLNMKAGRDISLLGQGVEGRLESFSPSIDLVVQPTIEMGRQAGRQILLRINQPEDDVHHIVLPMKLLERKGTYSRETGLHGSAEKHWSGK